MISTGKPDNKLLDKGRPNKAGSRKQRNRSLPILKDCVKNRRERESLFLYFITKKKKKRVRKKRKMEV